MRYPPILPTDASAPVKTLVGIVTRSSGAPLIAKVLNIAKSLLLRMPKSVEVQCTAPKVRR